MRHAIPVASAVLTGFFLLVQVPAAWAGAERGQLLYENHCQVCHTSVVHVREQRKVVTPVELRALILRWSSELKLPWQDDERADVYRYLNNRYYKFPIEAPAK